jgi:hypothetical protein
LASDEGNQDPFGQMAKLATFVCAQLAVLQRCARALLTIAAPMSGVACGWTHYPSSKLKVRCYNNDVKNGGQSHDRGRVATGGLMPAQRCNLIERVNKGEEVSAPPKVSRLPHGEKLADDLAHSFCRLA